MIQTREMDRVVMTVGPLICRPEGKWSCCLEVGDLLLHLVGSQSCCSEGWRPAAAMCGPDRLETNSTSWQLL